MKTPKIMLTFEGQTLSIPEWSKILGIPKATIYCRWVKGYPVYKILSKSSFRLRSQ